MAVTPYNTNILRALKWQQNNAPNITNLLTFKSNWYSQFHFTFWTNWYTNVFNLATCNTFGIMIWCIILGVPSQLFGLYPNTAAWAYGINRQNYVWSGSQPPPSYANTLGGNFAGGGQTTVLNIQEARWALMLRYAALVCNGRISFINYMLNWIFNNGTPWTMASGNYFYVADCTLQGVAATGVQLFANGVLIPAANYTLNATTGAIVFGSGHAPANGAALTWSGSWNSGTATAQAFGIGTGTALAFQLTNPPGGAPPVSGAFSLVYHIGPNMGFSAQFVNLLNSPEYGIMPTCAGSSYTVVVDAT